MVVPSYQRKDRTLPVFTLVLDNEPTEDQKFFCRVCQGTAFKFWGNLVQEFDFDIYNNPSEESKQYMSTKSQPLQVECTHFIQHHISGFRTRCRTFYMITRTA